MVRHDKDLLKASLTIDDIKKLLHELGAEHADYNEVKNELTTNTICHNQSSGSSKLIYYPNIENPSFHCYTGCSCSMDIYELVRRNYALRGIELSFSDTVNWVAERSGRSFGFGFSVDMEDSGNNDEMEWLNRFTKKKVIEYPPLKEYSDRILNVFESGYYDESFLSDNINISSMKNFDIKFHAKTNSVIIPHRHPNTGNIIGIRSRNLNPLDVENGYKYVPTVVQGVTYSFPTYQSLFGLYQNQEAIRRLKKVVIFESEKSVMQCSSYFGHENNFTVALSGRNISQIQVDMLLDLGIEEIILALDKQFKETDTRLCEEDIKFIVRMARRFTPYVRTYTLFDTEGLLNYKDSPSDAGKAALIQLMATKKEILNKE